MSQTLSKLRTMYSSRGHCGGSVVTIIANRSNAKMILRVSRGYFCSSEAFRDTKFLP